MSPIAPVIPDGKKVIADYLRSHLSITALNARVVGKSPEDKSTPWIRVTQLTVTNDTTIDAEHYMTYMLQFDCFVSPSEGHPQARTLAHTIRATLSPPVTPFTSGTVHVGGVVFIDEAEEVDTNFEPAKEYVSLTGLAMMHG